MSEAKTDTAVAVADRIMDSLDKVGAKIGEAAPVAFKNIVAATYADAISCLVMGGVFLVLFLIAVGVAVYFIRMGNRESKKQTGQREEIFIIATCGCLAGGLAAIVLLANIFFNINSTTLTKLISPEGYATQQLVTAAIGG